MRIPERIYAARVKGFTSENLARFFWQLWIWTKKG